MNITLNDLLNLDYWGVVLTHPKTLFLPKYLEQGNCDIINDTILILKIPFDDLVLNTSVLNDFKNILLLEDEVNNFSEFNFLIDNFKKIITPYNM